MYREDIIPRPINYINKLKSWARKTNGDVGLRLALIHTLNLFLEGSVKVEEVNKMVDKYAKTVKVVAKEEDDDISQIDDYLKDVQDYLESSLEN
jgi:hypothetical protein